MAKKKKGSALMKIGVGVFVLAAAGGGALAMAASQYVPTIAPTTTLGDVSLTGMTRETAAKAVAKWFEEKKAQQITLVSDELQKNPSNLTAEKLGVELDIDATLAKAPVDTFWTNASRQISKADDIRVELEPVYKFRDAEFAELASFVSTNAKPRQTASVSMEGSRIRRTPEIAGVELNPSELPEIVTRLLNEGGEAEIPLATADKRIPDSELEKITDVLAEFSTNFNSGQVARSHNIKLAAEKINGLVLMPGESFKFNEHVGRRTTASGFKTAGVYVNGRHDFDVGGGICQVSTTLYNAALLSDLKINKRFNHSLPVPYVPLGRDAAVSFPNPDLVIENNRDVPIALVATYHPGKVTFKVLSTPDPGLEVKVEQGAASSWSNGVKYVHDGTLAYGQEKLVDKGGNGRKVTTWRVVYRNGVEVRRDPLITSTYRGGPRIVARNNNAKPPAANPTESAPAGGAVPGTPATNSGTSAPRANSTSTMANR